MITISLCMIVKNEEKVLSRCLESAKKIADEIIIVDTGSTDRTIEIAKNFTDKIYNFKWIEDFSAARNFSFSHATQEYLLWLDADDVITEENQKKFLALKENFNRAIDIVYMQYFTAVDDQGNPLFSYTRERLVKREKNFKWVDPIHEVISCYGNTIESEIAIVHSKLEQGDPYRNIRIFEKMQSDGVVLNPRQEYYYTRELHRHQQYEQAIKKYEKIIHNPENWIINRIESCLEQSRCYNALNDTDNQFLSLLKSFTLDLPKAEICYEIGNLFFEKKEYQKAIFWYKFILSLDTQNDNGFHQPDLYEFSPLLQLVVCYYRIGDIPTATLYHEKTKALKPYHKSVIYNEQFFGKKGLN